MSIEDIKPDTSLYTDPADRLIALGLAMKAGGGMQRRAANSTSWEDVGSATNILCLRLALLANGVEYRVAPPKPREVWAVFYECGTTYAYRQGGEDVAKRLANEIGGTYAKFVEVL